MIVTRTIRPVSGSSIRTPEDRELASFDVFWMLRRGCNPLEEIPETVAQAVAYDDARRRPVEIVA